MRILNPAGPEFREKGKFERRAYYSDGVLYAIHMDNNDKMKVCSLFVIFFCVG